MTPAKDTESQTLTKLTRAQTRVILSCVEQGSSAAKGSDRSTLRVLELKGFVVRNNTRPQRFLPTVAGVEWVAARSRHLPGTD